MATPTSPRPISKAVTKAGREKAPSAKALAIFTRQLSVMIDAGLPLVQCLEILGVQEQERHFSAVILQTRADVEGGTSLAEAMRKHPKTFDAMYANMIAAGEAGGILDIILKRLATYIEKTVKLNAQIQSAMIYPTAIVVFTAAVVAVILWIVIPTFASLLTGLDATLPWPTRMVIAASDLTVQFMPYGVVAMAAVVYLFKRYYATQAGRATVDRLILQLPVIGPVLRKIAVARFCRTLSTLISAGVPILESLDITARTSGNVIVETAVLTTRKRIERGETIARPLRQTGVFPAMVVQMIAVGEATGALDGMLAKIAEFYEDEVDTAVAGMLKLLEPGMIAVLGIVVGGIVISMYLPIFELIAELAG